MAKTNLDMKKILVIPVLLVLMSFSQCDKDQFDSESPVKFTQKKYQDWVGGRPGSQGTLVTLIGQIPEKNIAFDSIYFRSNVAKLNVQLDDQKLTLTANFVKINPKDRDLILSGDAKEEFGNKPPKKLPKIPFEMSDNEVIISYFYKKKKRYFRLEKLQKEKPIYYQ